MPLPTLFIKGSLRHGQHGQAELDEFRPIDYIKHWFTMHAPGLGPANRVLVLKSETASGKSTALPPELFKDFVRGTTRGMVVTQPRVLTAKMNVAEMLLHYGDMLRLGDTIGWSSKYNKLRPQNVGLLSTTIDTLSVYLKIMSDAEIMAKWQFIIIDEVHERSLKADVVLAMIKNFLTRCAGQRDCPFVILMSATFDAEKYCRYFGVTPLSNYIWCTGQSVGRAEHWDWNEGRIVNDYPRAVAAIVEKISQTDDGEQGDVLCFLPGRTHFLAAKVHLDALAERLAASGGKVFTTLIIDSDAQNTENVDFRRLLQPRSEQVVQIGGRDIVPSRRVILSTNVAETGLTLENLTYVIDSGFNKEIEYNPIYDSRTIMVKPAAQSRIVQRMGRAGRKHYGHFYPLYPRYVYDRLDQWQLPQIITDDVLACMLDLCYEQLRAGIKTARMTGGRVDEVVFQLDKLQLIDSPSMDSLWTALERLYALGFVSPVAPAFSNIYDTELPSWDRKRIMQQAHPERGWSLTTLGHIAYRIPFPPYIARMVLAGWSYGAPIVDLITLGCILLEGYKALSRSPASPIQLPPLTSVPGAAEDDFVRTLMLWRDLKGAVGKAEKSTNFGKIEQWCNRVGASLKAVCRIIALRDEYLEQMYIDDFDVFAGVERSMLYPGRPIDAGAVKAIQMCVMEGYRCNYMIQRAPGEYETMTGLRVSYAGTGRSYYYRELSLKYSDKTDTYKPAVDMVMPALVEPDENFLA